MISTVLKQWCPECQAATESKPCTLCGCSFHVFCAECHDHNEGTTDWDEWDWPGPFSAWDS